MTYGVFAVAVDYICTVPVPVGCHVICPQLLRSSIPLYPFTSIYFNDWDLHCKRDITITSRHTQQYIRQ